jgi:hypothetical protein
MTVHSRTQHGFAEPPFIGGARPSCGACGSAEYLVFEEYVPARVMPGKELKPPEVSYSCLRCGQFNAHEVPADWEPPGWFWYA